MADGKGATSTVSGLPCRRRCRRRVGRACGRLDTQEQIRQRFGVLREMVDGVRPAGSVSDDTMQTLCLAESLAELGRFDADDFVRRLLRWYRTDPFGIGIHTKRVLSLVAQGISWREAVERVEQQHAPMTAGNGSLMRCAPIALRYYRDIGGLLEFSHESSRVTHPNPLARSSALSSTAFFRASCGDGRKRTL
jgi:ADP-ribosyl-[dinitrogen reductase] hydrolase